MTMRSTPPDEDSPRKKRYERPRLETYGDIRIVTAAVAHNTPDADGAAHALKTG